MNIKKTVQKWPTKTVAAAICSSVFLFAACEPRDNDQPEAPEEEQPTFGEPEREPAPPPAEEPPADDYENDDQWEDDTMDQQP